MSDLDPKAPDLTPTELQNIAGGQETEDEKFDQESRQKHGGAYDDAVEAAQGIQSSLLLRSFGVHLESQGKDIYSMDARAAEDAFLSYCSDITKSRGGSSGQSMTKGQAIDLIDSVRRGLCVEYSQARAGDPIFAKVARAHKVVFGE